VFATLGALYLLVLSGVLFKLLTSDTLAPEPLSWGQRAAVTIFLIFFTVAEAGLLALVNALFERAVWSLGVRVPAARTVLDTGRALALAGLAAALAASLLKLVTARAHLRVTDLWFVVTNFHQLRQESLGTELSSAVLAGGGFVALTLALFAAFRVLRRKGPDTPASSVALLTAFALLGAGVSWWRYEAVPATVRALVPEIHWLTRTTASDLADEAAAPESAAARAAIPPETRPLIVPYRPSAPPRAENVVLIMLESLPWNRVGFLGGPPGITPNLDRLAEESVVFTRPYTASVHSDYAQMAILSSLYPRKLDHHDYYLDLAYPRALLWDALRPAGWRTAMFSCQNEAWGNMLAFLRTPGLERMVHSPDFPPDVPRKGRGAESKVYEEAVVEAWRDWLPDPPGPLDGTAAPYFTYLNFQATHFPYTVPPDAPRPRRPFEIDFPASYLGFPREKIPVMENRFYNALAYADHWVGEVRRTLEERGEWERTALVVVSDHGEAFYEHEQPTHGTALYEEQVRSLWLMRLPGEEPRRIEEPVSLLDVAPSLLAYLGLPPHGNFQGRGDVLDPAYRAEGRPLLFTIQGMTFEDGLLLDGWKYMINWDRQVHRLFHLPSDPGETRDLLEGEPETVQRLQGILLELLGRQLRYYGEHGWEAGEYPPELP